MTERHVGDFAEAATAGPMKTTDPKSTLNATAGPPDAAEIQWEGHIADDVGATFGPEPMARLRATRESLFLTSSRGDFRLPRDTLRRIGRGKFYPWLFAAVRFHHTRSDLPRDLQFKPLRARPRDILHELRALGYPVS